MYQFLWIFFVYAFLGWCTEVSYAALRTGRFVNRGFLNGPICPIYGFGVVIVLLCLTLLKKSLPLLFLGSVVLTSLLEGLTGFVLEKIFHQRWWDYSDEPFNLGGYICLRFSIAWGLACLFVVDMLHPTVLFVIRHIPHTLGLVLLGVLGVVTAVDLTATVRTIAKLNRQLSQIDEMAAKIKEASNDFGEGLAEKVLDAAEKGSNLKEDLDEWADAVAERREDWEDALAERKAELREDLGEFKEELDTLRESMLQHKAVRRFQKEQRKTALRAELEERRAKLQELMDRDVFGRRRLLAAFPRMRSTDHRQALERLRRRMEQRRISRGK